jgi:predicted MFS family arabinose efflux permease
VYSLVVLTLVYALNIADRFVVSTVLEPIRLELHLSDSAVALISGVALALFYVSVGIPLATFADRANRRNLVAAALGLWSAMTALCGLAQNVWQFVLGRFGVGIGEAGGTPPSTSMLADEFSPRHRPAVLTLYALGAPLGAWLGSDFAGAIAEHYRWRGVFLALGVPGLVLALLVYFTVREPRRGDRNEGAGLRAQSLLSALRTLVNIPSAIRIIGGGSVATLWGWGLMWWTPTFLMRKYGLSVGEAGALLGPMHLYAGSLATILTSVVVMPLAARDPRRVVWLMGVVVLLATVPSILIYTTESLSVATGLLWIVVPSIYFFIGPTMGLLQNVVPPTMRAQTIAVLLFVANVANLIIAPQGIGLLSDALAPVVGGNIESLRWALIALAPTGFWAGWLFLSSGRTLRQDEAAAGG